jgi:hypothetical protein
VSPVHAVFLIAGQQMIWPVCDRFYQNHSTSAKKSIILGLTLFVPMMLVSCANERATTTGMRQTTATTQSQRLPSQPMGYRDK